MLGATAVVRDVRNKPNLASSVNALLARRPAQVVTVAVANKLARIVWRSCSAADVPRKTLWNLLKAVKELTAD